MAGFFQLWHRKVSGRLGVSVTAGLLISAAVAFSTEDTDSGLFIPPKATVVLMTSLPGDVESENAYRDQLQAWLEILANNGTARKIIVLTDAPELLNVPANLEVKVLKADRTTFQGLGTSLANETDPVLVIAWGHGGRQGSLPVFHVRGPRVTPTDFQALAGKFSTVTSHWILLFRGSGAFARQLAGPGRAVLSSDFDTIFNSDPISMSLLVKIARADPKITLGNSAEHLGKATSEWYTERHLARTEEPTLWAGELKPKPLATDEHSESTENLESSSTGKKVEQPDPILKDLPAVWKEISRVDASKYPGADAVILRRRLSYTLASSPAVATEQEEFIQVLTLEGERFGDFDISYTPPFEELNFLECEVLRPDGKLSRLDPDAIREERPETLGDYQLGRRKVFSLPGVVPGAVLHVRYRTEWQKFPLPHASMEIALGQDSPVLEATIQVRVPKEGSFHFALEHMSATDPKITQSSYGTAYTWNFRDLSGLLREPLAPPRQQPRLLISTVPDWRTFADWYSRISKLTDQITPEIAAKATEVSRGAKTDREKVIALYNYVAGLRYVAIPLGVNSFRPHAAENVLQNQFGDCKDKANLFNALLHVLNIEAHLVLLPRFSQAYDNVPGLAFNHAISRVLLEGEPIWVDTTDDVCRFGLLPPGDPGRKVLVIDGKTTALTELPRPQSVDHQLALTAKVDCTNPAEALPMTLQIKTRGYPDYELRATAREYKAQATSLPLLAAKFHPVAGSFALEEQSATRISALDEDFSSQAKGSWIGGATPSAGNCILRAPFWIPKQWEAALHRRKSPLFMNEGYPLTLEEQFEFTLPPKAKVEPLPGNAQNRAGPLQWRIEWAKVGDDKISATFRAELARGELSLAETADFQNQLRGVLSALGRSASFSLP